MTEVTITSFGGNRDGPERAIIGVRAVLHSDRSNGALGFGSMRELTGRSGAAILRERKQAALRAT